VIALITQPASRRSRTDQLSGGNYLDIHRIQRAEQLRRTVQRLELEKRQLLLDQEEQIKQSQDEPEMKECPMCAELVRKRAKICKHCRHSFEEL
jgi:hypothetical protein